MMMTRKESCSPAAQAGEVYDKICEEGRKAMYLEWTKAILSLPIPMSYEVWSELHRYLEKLE